MDASEAPRLLVIRRGSLGQTASGLIRNLRLLFSPNCASKLKEGGKQSIKDFLSVKNLLNLSHLIMISQSKKFNNKSAVATLKIVKLDQGPTLTFSIDKVALMNDISMVSNRNIPALKLLIPPLLVLHGFKKDEIGIKIASILQNMFPKVENDNFRRVVLCKMDQDYFVEIRQFVSQKIDLNVSDNVRKLKTRGGLKKLVNQGVQIVKLFEQTENEDDEVMMYRDHIPGFTESTQGIRLIEVGPRLTLKLVKIESEICTGAVLYHRYINKTDEEIKELNLKEPKMVKKRKREMMMLEKVVKKAKKKDNKHQ